MRIPLILLPCQLMLAGCAFRPQPSVDEPANAIALTSGPPRAAMRFEVARPDGTWGSSVSVRPGARVEWRIVVDWTDPDTSAGPSTRVISLSSVYYQPLIGGADLSGPELKNRDRLASFRNNGVSGTFLSPQAKAAVLTTAEGNSTAAMLNGYGRVRLANTARGAATSPLFDNALTSFDHPGPSPQGAVSDYIRIAGRNNPTPYPPSIPMSTDSLLRQIFNGVVSDDYSSPEQLTGFTIFRHALLISVDQPAGGTRTITLTSELASARRKSTGVDDARFMMWACVGDLVVIPVAFSVMPATIAVDPAAAPWCDDIDFNNDGIEQEPTDVEAFLSVLGGGPCIPLEATCNDTDFNNDGIEYDPTDFESFLYVYVGGPCT